MVYSQASIPNHCLHEYTHSTTQTIHTKTQKMLTPPPPSHTQFLQQRISPHPFRYPLHHPHPSMWSLAVLHEPRQVKFSIFSSVSIPGVFPQFSLSFPLVHQSSNKVNVVQPILHGNKNIFKNIFHSSKYCVSSSETKLLVLFCFSFTIQNEHYNIHKHLQLSRQPCFDDLDDRRIYFVHWCTCHRSIYPFHPFLHASALLVLYFQAWSIQYNSTQPCPIQDCIQISQLASVQFCSQISPRRHPFHDVRMQIFVFPPVQLLLSPGRRVLWRQWRRSHFLEDGWWRWPCRFILPVRT